MIPFGRVFGVERGAMILCALIPALTILAIRALSIAVHGRVQPLALLALPFTYSFTFLFGFMNFNTGVVAMLWSTVAWYRLQDRPASVRAPVIAVLATACWVCQPGRVDAAGGGDRQSGADPCAALARWPASPRRWIAQPWRRDRRRRPRHAARGGRGSCSRRC